MTENILTFLSFSSINVSFCFVSFLNIRNRSKLMLLSFLPYILTLVFLGLKGGIDPKEHFVFIGTAMAAFVYLRTFYLIIPYAKRFFAPVFNPEVVGKVYQSVMIIMALFFTLLTEYMVGDWIFNPEAYKEIWG